MFEKGTWRSILIDIGCGGKVADRWAPVLAEGIQHDTFSAGDADLYEFLPQILHESAMLGSLVENMRYSAGRIRELGEIYGPKSRWGAAAKNADALAYNPRALAEAVYGGRFGNDTPGDGWKYIGRSPLGITFKDNYAAVDKILGTNYVDKPELLEQPAESLRACIGWWENKVPDEILGNTRLVRRVVQGGELGLAEVQRLKERLKAAVAKWSKS